MDQEHTKRETATALQPQFVTKPAFTVVGLRIRTRPMTQDIPQLWDKFVPRIGEIQHGIEPHVSYGLMGNFDPQAGEVDYMAGNPIETIAELPKGMTGWDVPANTYAVFETTLPKISETFDAIYNAWLPASSYQQAAGPYFERYGEDFSPDTPKLSIYIPVEKRS